MNPLSPDEAAKIADGVYLVQKLRGVNLQNHSDQLGIMGTFSTDAFERVEGTSGGIFFRSTSGFGYVAGGIGCRGDEAVIAIRGTATVSDCLTDISIAVENGPSGHLVHAGFRRTFTSFQSSLISCLEKVKPSGVHVVGHSLGGALATMIADHLHTLGINVKLYSFGAPRSGLNPHCLHLSKALPAENIFRVFHSADPVSMIPIYPFHHAPVSTTGYCLPFSGSISCSAHFMRNYVASVNGHDWKSIRQFQTHGGVWNTADGYLDLLERHHGVVMLSAAYLRLLLQALESITDTLGACIGVTAVSAATLLDRLAQLLYSGYLLSGKISNHTKRLLQAILKFLGRPVNDIKNVTVQFISWILKTLFSIISSMAVRAIHIDGQD